MITYFKHGSTASIISGVPCSFGSYETLKIALEGYSEGTVFINGQRVDIKDGGAVIPQQFIGEGVNRIRLRIDGQTYNAENIIKIGSTLHGERSFGGEVSLVELSARAARLEIENERLKNKIAALTSRIDEIQNSLKGHDLFNFN